MQYRKAVIVALSLAVLATNVVTAFAGSTMAFSQGVSVWVNANSCAWKRCASVPINVTEPGYVVVTASGMATFNSNAVLALTLGTTPAARGDWQFWVTAAEPMPSYQSFTVRRVFQVTTPQVYNFYLNANSCRNPPGRMHVETGSITAEFYPEADVEAVATPAMQQQLKSGARPAR